MAKPIEQLSLEQQMMLMLADRLDPDAGVGTNQAIVEARSSLKKFTTYTMSEYQVNWHHDVFFEKLEAWCRGEITRLMIFAPPQHGKALALSTPIPTPSGWTEMGQLRVGDWVFSDTGYPCQVVAVSPVWKERPVWKVSTGSGQFVLADGEHLWRVRIDRKSGKVSDVSTKRLAERTSPRRPLVKIHGSIKTAERNLQILPYTLGVWLGDGCSHHATITQGDQDFDEVKSLVEQDGYKTSERGTDGTFGILGLWRDLQDMGLAGNKHIPPEYLRASVRQRMELLQGLIDTDGHVAPSGSIEFTSVNKRLADDFLELVVSLGVKAVMGTGRATINGRDCGPKYRITFYMDNAAKLKRKARFCKNGVQRPDYYLQFEPAGFADTVCIQVDSPSSMFLCGRDMVPTHNSEVVSRRLPAYILGRNPDEFVISCSYNNRYASRNNRDVQAIIDSDAYREVFPGTQMIGKGRNVHGSWQRNSRQFHVVGRRGGYLSAGIRSGISGEPFTKGIIDDPVRDDADALSPVIQEAIFNWYCTVFSARKTRAGAGILITMTRWSQNDLAGRLLDAAKRDPKVDQWVVVKFPNILETEAQRTEYDHRKIGECLWPERHPQKEVEAERAILSALKWSAVHQQEPSPARGVVFRRDDFRYFHTENTPDGMVLVLQDSPDSTPRRFRASDCQFYQVCDAADTTNTTSAYTAVGTFARTTDNDLCVFHFWRAKLEFPLRYKNIVSLRDGPPEGPPWPTTILYQAMEAKASGISMIQQGASEGKPFRALKTGSLGKEARATNVADLYENKKVFHRQGQPWLTDFEAEILAFPSGQYMDQADVLAHAGILYVQGTSAKGLTEELLLGREPPREADGSVSLKNTSLDPEINVFQVGRYEVEFEDDW